MASYYDDHNLPRPTSTSTSTPRPRERLDLSSFWDALNHSRTNPTSEDDDPFRNLAQQFAQLPETPLLQGLIEQLRSAPKEEKGMPQDYLDGLERVDKKRLGEKMCPICAERFLDDPYPLVVRLPCHPEHWFDLQCIQPWLALQTTCPLDRVDLMKKAKPAPPVVEDDEEEEWDEYYA